MSKLPGIGVVVLSYNRPRLLAEALQSIKGAQQIVVADDGSTFDVDEVVTRHAPKATIVRNPPISGAERIQVARSGALFNRAARTVTQPYVTYLCDDDLFAPKWISAVRRFFAANPEAHICRGDWHTLGTDTSSFTPALLWVLTTGNFATRTSCLTEEGCEWPEFTFTSHDGVMLTKYLEKHHLAHGGPTVPYVGTLAGWRREHPFNMLPYSIGTSYAAGVAALMEGGMLEEAVA